MYVTPDTSNVPYNWVSPDTVIPIGCTCTYASFADKTQDELSIRNPFL